MYKTAKLLSQNIVSVGASLERVHVPGRALPDPNSDEIIPTEMIEVGMGIHNEPGSHRVTASLPDLVKTMLAQMLDWRDEDRAFIRVSSSDKVVLFMNNLGGVSNLELSGVTAEVSAQLKKDYGLTPVRTIQGAFLTSLNGMGFSVSILKLVDAGLGAGKSMLELLDAPTEAVGWAAPVRTSTWDNPSDATMDKQGAAKSEEKPSNLKSKLSIPLLNLPRHQQLLIRHPVDPQHAKKALTSGLKQLIAAEAEVTKYDTIVGDGDCGIGLKRGAEAIMKMLDSTQLNDDAVSFVSKIISVVENSMDGTSGALYAIFLNTLAHGLREQDSGSEKVVDAHVWAQGLRSSLQALGKYTPAQPGDRTLMDALAPFVEVLGQTGDVLQAAKKAEEGAEGTKGMKASLGRTVYVGGESEWVGKVPDPGAHGLSVFLTGLAEAC